MRFDIAYGASKARTGGYAPQLYVNGAWRYHLLRNRKTARGALAAAKLLAEKQAALYTRMSASNIVTISEIGA